MVAGMEAQLLASSAPSGYISSIDTRTQYPQQQRRQLMEQWTTFFAEQNHSVPPETQSIEMPPDSGQFFSQAGRMPQQTAYHRGYQPRILEQQDVALTSLVSPSVILDPDINMENASTAPEAILGPFTSPALNTQNDPSSVYDNITQSDNSPEKYLAALAMPLSGGSSTVLANKARKYKVINNWNKCVKSSYLVKPRHWEIGPNPGTGSQMVIGDDDRNLLKSSDQRLLPLPDSSTQGSDEHASASPKSLLEIVPPRKSTTKSPYIQAQEGNKQQPTPHSFPDRRAERRAEPAAATVSRSADFVDETPRFESQEATREPRKRPPS
ncbi:phosphorus acquisition-controlling protein [Pochonia chlamydosporia 170]|uniref:Phosphorus acquisition-controlling protein n=1 Tax=Pochonia chlamydosporia 170 TaxID=1380566 RepID=A0A179EX36_METCM|nr:phosphorus acquisition-controlling protein [Pochonia chlamydosporia 170]OAQ57746.2 phosphorus acquisition-controlling protein [Pochonia chlamydosporia 170]